MQPMTTIRNWQFQQMERSLLITKFILDTTAPDALTTYRDSGEGWTVTEVLCHLRDFETVFYERARLTMTQDLPPLPFPDPDGLAVEKRYAAQDAKTVLAEWGTIRGDFLDYLNGVAKEDWERAASHPNRGRFTLHDQLFLTVWHDNTHIEQITRILAEKRD